MKNITSRSKKETFVVSRRTIKATADTVHLSMATNFHSMRADLIQLAAQHRAIKQLSMYPGCLDSQNRISTFNHYKAELEKMLEKVNQGLHSAHSLNLLDSIREEYY